MSCCDTLNSQCDHWLLGETKRWGGNLQGVVIFMHAFEWTQESISITYSLVFIKLYHCIFFFFYNNPFPSLAAFIPTQFSGYSTPAERGRLQGECWKLVHFKQYTPEILFKTQQQWLTRYNVFSQLRDFKRHRLPCFCPPALCYWSHFCLAVCQRCVCHSCSLAHWEGRTHQFAQY